MLYSDPRRCKKTLPMSDFEVIFSFVDLLYQGGCSYRVDLLEWIHKWGSVQGESVRVDQLGWISQGGSIRVDHQGESVRVDQLGWINQGGSVRVDQLGGIHQGGSIRLDVLGWIQQVKPRGQKCCWPTVQCMHNFFVLIFSLKILKLSSKFSEN